MSTGVTAPSTDPGSMHPSVTSGPDNSTSQENHSNDQANSSSVSNLGEDSVYPEQKHAGKIGYGPLYNQGPGFIDKIGGLKEKVVGKVKQDPDLVQHGKDRMTGIAKHKQMEEDQLEDPFATPEGKKSPSVPDEQKFEEPSTPLQVHQRGEKEVEEAATLDPEGTDEA